MKVRTSLARLGRICAAGILLTGLTSSPLLAATFTVVNEDFEAYTGAATSIDDTSDADPAIPGLVISDDTPFGPAAGSGVQLIDWLAHSGTKSLLLRPGTEARLNMPAIRSGKSYQLDFWTHAVREATSSQNFLMVLRGAGSDINGDDYLAYRVDRATNSTVLFYYDGVGPGASAWVATGKNQTPNAWQHHRMVINPNAMTFDLFVDDMVTPAVTGAELSRCEVALPTLIRIVNEGNTADDGYYAIDDITLTVEDSLGLDTTFTDGFESYSARTAIDDDADPQGFWITTEVDGTGQGRVRAPGKVQVVDSTVVPAHSGTKCLKIEGGQRAGVTLAWGVPPQSDVQITWWARLPEAVQETPTADAVILRMSLYGAENGDIGYVGTGTGLTGDNALLGYGIRRQSSTNLGDGLSLLYFAGNWWDTGVGYTANAWEQYRLTTHTTQGRYTILKNPSSANPEIIVDQAPMVGSATNWMPVVMAGWSSSNGTNHPPVYIDDVEIKSLVSIPEPGEDPYTVTLHSDRYTNVTTLQVGGQVGDVAVDPRDNSTILFTVDNEAGAIYKATKVASGNWVVDPTPLATGLDRPSGLAVANDGTIWWTHDFTAALMRLKAPWASNTPELVITNFGTAVTDDDPIDVVVAPSTFNGTLGQPGMIVVADRGSDTDEPCAVNLVMPNSPINQTNDTFLVTPTSNLGNNLNAMTVIPQSGEIVTLSGNGWITAVDANGLFRYIIPLTFWSDLTVASGSAIAADPTTSRIWLLDDVLDEIWSVASDGATPDR
ncbi:MAG TPA: hypothetical protein VN673_00890, partial [Clostridia bacterium]|nr:hypothetical protein [Clostridia bacterium]